MCLNDITIKIFRDVLSRIQLAKNELHVSKRFLFDSFVNKKIKKVPSVQKIGKVNLTSYFAVQPMLMSGENICQLLLPVILFVLLTLPFDNAGLNS